MPESTYYKVVSTTPEPGVFAPAFMPRITHIIYKIGETTKPPKDWGPLAAFKSLPAAITFIHKANQSNLIVLKGTGTPSNHDLLWYKYKDGGAVENYDVPEDTAFLSTFTPEEEVKAHA